MSVPAAKHSAPTWVMIQRGRVWHYMRGKVLLGFARAAWEILGWVPCESQQEAQEEVEKSKALYDSVRSQGAGQWRTDEPPQEESILALIEYQISSKPAEEHIVCMLRGDDLVDEAGDDIGWTKEVIRKWMPLSSVGEGAGQCSCGHPECDGYCEVNAASPGLASPPEGKP